MPEPEEPTPEEVPPPPAAPGFDWSRPPEAVPARPPLGSTEGLGGLIPAKNPKALIAYYCGVFSLIPCLGLLLGPVALILGVLGLRAIQESPALPGKVHAWIGIILGGLVFVAHIALIVLIIINARPSPG